MMLNDTAQQALLAPAAGRRERRRRSGLSAGASALVMLVPAVALCTTFIVIPAILAIVGSLHAFRVTSADWTFVGLGNYATIATDPIFWLALRNNIIIVVGSIVLQVGFGTVLAAILDRGIPYGSTVFRTIIFAPVVVSTIAVALIWLIIYDPNIGILNAIVRGVGLSPPTAGWLGHPDYAIWMLLIVAAWHFTGFIMVLMLAGLQSIPKELYEAASLDNARGIRAFWHVTLPSIRNILIVAVLITTIGGFKVFDLIYATTLGGPGNATQVLGTYVYLQAFTLGNMGIANAISVILLLIAVVLGILQLRASRRA